MRLPSSGADPGPLVWLLNTGGDGTTPVEWYLKGVLDFLSDASRAFDQEGSPNTRVLRGRAKPLVGLPVVGTGQGGRLADRGDLLKGLLQSLEAAASDLDIDIALVAHEDSDFAALQAVRTRDASARTWQGLSQPLVRKARKLAGEARGGNLVLFLGAGVSAGVGLPTWDQLIAELAVPAHLDPEQLRSLGSTLDQAQLIRSRLGLDALREQIKKRFSAVHRYPIASSLLAALPVREWVTTNYDRLFEDASRDAGRPVAVLPYESARLRDRWLLKMHGSINHPKDIVLTREDYLRYLEARGALAGIVQAMLITRHMLFVGFSLSDENFLRIADDVRRVIRQPGGGSRPARKAFGTALTLSTEPFRAELWQEDIETVAVDSGGDAGPETQRRFEILLDAVCAHAVSRTRHLLDPAFDKLLTQDERELRDALNDFDSKLKLKPGARRTEAWAEVSRLLASLGGATKPGETESADLSDSEGADSGS